VADGVQVAARGVLVDAEQQYAVLTAQLGDQALEALPGGPPVLLLRASFLPRQVVLPF